MNTREIAWAGVVLLVLVGLSTPALSQAGGDDATIQNVSYTGDSAVDAEANDTVLWRDGPHEFTVTVTSDGGLGDGTVCLLGANASSESELGCRSASVQSGESASIAVAFDAWPNNGSGDQSVRVEVRSGDGERTFHEESLELTVLGRNDDRDDDGLVNQREVEIGTDLRANDSDGDGLSDGTEVNAFDTDPLSNDTDGDGLQDGEEIRTFDTDPAVVDTDDDGLDDAREVANGTNPNVADTDRDGLDDALELNTYGTNATTADTDGDGIGDGAEVNTHDTNPNRADTDGDGLADNLEIHTYGTDPSAIDTDGDGLQDGAEVDEYRTDPTARDSDDDGLSDGDEGNIYQTNPNKADTDGDGLDDGAEVNRFETDPKTVDTDGDGVSDAEEATTPWTAALGRPAVLAAACVLLVAVGGLFLYRPVGPLAFLRGGAVGDAASQSASGEQGAPPAVGDRTADESQAGGANPEPGPSDAAVSSASAGTAQSTEGETTDDRAADEESVDLDLLPNTEVVLAVLDDNGGQIRQSELVEETGWSKAKVSRVLSKMEADEEIVKVSVGRGNLITTPGDLPSGVQSPFDD